MASVETAVPLMTVESSFTGMITSPSAAGGDVGDQQKLLGRRRGVYHREVELVLGVVEGETQRLLGKEQLVLVDEVDGARDHAQVGDGGGVGHPHCRKALVEKADDVAGGLGCFVEAEIIGGGSLRVEVDEERPQAAVRRERGQVDRGGRLARSPFQVADCDDSHARVSFRSAGSVSQRGCYIRAPIREARFRLMGKVSKSGWEPCPYSASAGEQVGRDRRPCVVGGGEPVGHRLVDRPVAAVADVDFDAPAPEPVGVAGLAHEAADAVLAGEGDVDLDPADVPQYLVLLRTPHLILQSLGSPAERRLVLRSLTASPARRAVGGACLHEGPEGDAIRANLVSDDLPEVCGDVVRARGAIRPARDAP